MSAEKKRVGAFGPNHPRYKDGTTHTDQGYRIFSAGPHRGKRVHRVVVEQAIGRELLPDEVIHHLNEDKTDNRLENLSIETRATHMRKHACGGSLATCDRCGKQRWRTPSEVQKYGNRQGGYKCRPCWIATGGNKAALRGTRWGT